MTNLPDDPKPEKVHAWWIVFYLMWLVGAVLLAYLQMDLL